MKSHIHIKRRIKYTCYIVFSNRNLTVVYRVRTLLRGISRLNSKHVLKGFKTIEKRNTWWKWIVKFQTLCNLTYPELFNNLQNKLYSCTFMIVNFLHIWAYIFITCLRHRNTRIKIWYNVLTGHTFALNVIKKIIQDILENILFLNADLTTTITLVKCTYYD